jgi:carbon storage regulator
MLVLTRKMDEKIRIGKDIVLTVVEVKGNRVRLGIEAPLSVPVVRGELLPVTVEAKRKESEPALS